MSDDLGARLRRRIEDAGPITFAEFMESALYDPDGGFFEGGGRAAGGATVGVDGDFVTSPHVSPLFGTLLSRAVEEARTILGSPNPLTVVEVGAGDGAMAGPLAAGLSTAATELVLVERTGKHRRLLEALAPALPVPARVVHFVADLAPGSVVGCVLANEVLDNLPFHRVRKGPNGPVEVRVGVARGRLTLVETPPASRETAAAAERLSDGREALVPTGAHELLRDLGAVLARGFVLLIDYASGTGGAEVHGYRGQRAIADVLAGPGGSDVTAGVDFDDLGRYAEAQGFRSWGCVTQRDLLLALGYREEMDRLLARQGELLNEGRGAEATRLFSERSRASLLVDPGGLGGFRALCLGKDVPIPLPAWE